MVPQVLTKYNVLPAFISHHFFRDTGKFLKHRSKEKVRKDTVEKKLQATLNFLDRKICRNINKFKISNIQENHLQPTDLNAKSGHSWQLKSDIPSNFYIELWISTEKKCSGKEIGWSKEWLQQDILTKCMKVKDKDIKSKTQLFRHD